MLQPPPTPQVVVFETNATAAGVSVAFVASPDFDGAEGGGAGDSLLVLDPAVAAAALRTGASHAEARAAATSSLGEYRTAHQSPASPRSAARCTGAPAAAYTNVTMQPCASVGPAGQWALLPASPAASNSSGRWALPGGSLCLGGVNAATGTPNLAAVPCAAAGDRSQDFIAFAGVFGGGSGGGGALMSVAASAVLDIPASDASAGARVELYSPNGGSPNQRWTAGGPGGAIVSGLSGLCLAAC